MYKPRLERHSSNGFSILEVALVLIIALVVSAVALPRFVRSADTNHVERVQSTADNLRAAVHEIHQLWQSDGGSGSIRNLPSYLSGQIDTNASGYPTGIHDDDEIKQASDCAHLWLNVLPNPPSAWHNERLDPDYMVELSGGSCLYRYRRAAGISIVYRPADGLVVVDISQS